MYKGYLIDLDGTAYRGDQVIKEAVSFVNKLANLNIPFKFVTNNSSATESDVVAKLSNMGYIVNNENIVTTAFATASYIKDNFTSPKVFLIGSSGLIDAMVNFCIDIVDNYKDANIVVIGLDKELNYDKLSKACLAIRNGATFISTNPDIAIPTHKGLEPGNGSIVKLVETATETTPITIGKPYSHIMNIATKQLGLKPSDVAMIGDNYNTDILAGINVGMDTIFVNTGVTRKENLNHYDVFPTHICDGLDEFIDKL